MGDIFRCLLQTFLIGDLRLRQVRTPPVDCPRIVRNYVNDYECLTKYSIGKEDERSYTRGWVPLGFNETGMNVILTVPSIREDILPT